MTKKLNYLKNEEGTVIIAAIMILAVLSILAAFSMKNASVEIQVSSNDLYNNIAFYSADGSLELAYELLEQNLATQTGFNPDVPLGSEATINNFIKVTDLDFWANPTSDAVIPSDTSRHAYFPLNYGDGPHTNLTMGKSVGQLDGGALQMAAGYEGKAKGAAGGGTYLLYEINAQHKGGSNEDALYYRESILMIEYRHIVGLES